MSGGRTTHAYNPTVNAILNGYLAVEPFQETTNYKISNEPYIYEVEVCVKLRIAMEKEETDVDLDRGSR